MSVGTAGCLTLLESMGASSLALNEMLWIELFQKME